MNVINNRLLTDLISNENVPISLCVTVPKCSRMVFLFKLLKLLKLKQIDT